MKADNTITGTSDFVYKLILSRTYSVMKSKQLEGKEVLAVSSGGQHTVMIAKNKQ